MNLKHVFAASAFALASVAAAPALATTIDFTDQAIGVTASPLVYPEATFTSSTGTFYVGASGLDHEICPLTPGFNCEAALTVDFTSGVDGLSFLTTGYDSAATVSVSGTDAGGAFSVDIVTSGAFTYTIDLSAHSGITSLVLSSNDPAGLGYDDFTFNAAGVPEPASWAMMIAGVGMAGGALRRRRSVTTSVRFA